MVVKEETDSKFFYTKDLNQVKEDEVLQKAFIIREYKNFVSNKIHSNILEFSNLSRFDLIKKYSTIQVHGLTGKDKEYAITEVFTTYQNTFDK